MSEPLLTVSNITPGFSATFRASTLPRVSTSAARPTGSASDRWASDHAYSAVYRGVLRSDQQKMCSLLTKIGAGILCHHLHRLSRLQSRSFWAPDKQLRKNNNGWQLQNSLCGHPSGLRKTTFSTKHFLTTIREATQDKWTARPSDTAAVTLTLLMLPQGMDKLHVGVSRLFAEIGTKICWSFYHGNISALSVPFDLFVFSDTSSVTPDKSPATGKHTLFFLSFFNFCSQCVGTSIDIFIDFM